MKKDKMMVLNSIKCMDKSKLHFDLDCDDEYDKEVFNDSIHRLKSMHKIDDRVLEIFYLAQEYPTYNENNKFQCVSGANRSAEDIWRIYNNYFRPVSIFYIMRTLYKIVVENETIGTQYCHDINKQVFINDGGFIDGTFTVNELGVRFAEWRTIGL